MKGGAREEVGIIAGIEGRFGEQEKGGSRKTETKRERARGINVRRQSERRRQETGEERKKQTNDGE